MAYWVRPASTEDVERLGEIRAARALPWLAADEGSTRRGGFLLGASAEVYLQYVSLGCVRVAGRRQEGVAGSGKEQVVAFSVILPDEVVRRSPLYESREKAELAPGVLAWLESLRVAYFDQLVTEDGHTGAAAPLAYQHLIEAFETHDVALATTVLEPFENRAAQPFLDFAGFAALGSIDEHYPQVGALRSKIHGVSKERFEEARRTALAVRFERRLR